MDILMDCCRVITFVGRLGAYWAALDSVTLGWYGTGLWLFYMFELLLNGLQ